MALVDASGTAGAVALQALAAGGRGREVGVLEPSMAALRCARAALAANEVEVRAGLPWDLPAGTVSSLALVPPADRGNARVLAEIDAAVRALRPDGVLWIALNKDQGAKRYHSVVTQAFQETKVRARQRGWRLLEARNPFDRQSEGELWQQYQADGVLLESLPGVYSGKRLDPGTALLLAEAPWSNLAGQRVLDLGCGTGVVALRAAEAGADVVAADDDLAAVQSSERNSQRLGLALDVRHSDVDSALKGERFDFVLTNPPFHVGRGVRLEVPEAFLAAAHSLLVPGGELWLVANRDLPYERRLADWSSLKRVADYGGFKVLRATR